MADVVCFVAALNRIVELEEIVRIIQSDAEDDNL